MNRKQKIIVSVVGIIIVALVRKFIECKRLWNTSNKKEVFFNCNIK